MTVGGSGHESSEAHLVSGTVTGVIVRYVREAAGDAGVATALVLSGESRTAKDLEDAKSWSTQDATVALLDAAAEVTGDPNVAWQVGRSMIRQHAGTPTGARLQALGSPSELMRNLALAANTFTTVSTLEPRELGEHHAILRSIAPAGVARHRYFCDLTKGMLSEVPVVFGLPAATVHEPECQARGGRCCDYHLDWADQAGTDPGELAGRVRDLRGLLVEAYATAPDLVRTDLAVVLDQILGRAARALGAMQALAVVHAEGATRPHVSRFGVDEQDAGRIAQQLLAHAPALVPEGAVVVAIESPRQRYGWICVFAPASAATGSHREALTFYAASAAAAIDLASALEDARDSAESERALLSFSRALAGVVTAPDVARCLVDVMVQVVGCDDASVLLWDAMDHRLTVRARSRDPLRLAPSEFDPSRVGLVAVDATGHPAGNGVARVTDADDADGDAHDRGTGFGGSNGSGPSDSPLVLTEELTDVRASEPSLDDAQLPRAPVVGALMAAREFAVVDRSTQDEFVTELLDRHGCEAAILFPLFSYDDLLGLVTAEYEGLPPADLRTNHHRRDRIEGLADHAVTALQNALLLEQVGDQALHDPLTGLPNRQLLADRVEQALARTVRGGETSTLCYVDLDRLQRVNDTLGHAAGDELIRQVAHRLRETAREQDTVARLGADKLGVLLVGLSDRVAVGEMAHRMLDAVREPFHVAGAEIFTSVSIGVATAPRDGTTYDQLIANATEAAQRSKQNGRNTFTLFNGEDELAEADAQVRTDLRHALERDELFVLYQPYIDLQTTQVVGVEALVRWHHPTRGVLEPAAFILQAEESDLIVGIDLFVMREACGQMRQWADEGVTPLRMSVNISSRDLVHPGFVSSVVAALRDHGVPPEWLELEITERVTSDDDGVMRRAAEELRQLGVRFSLDDFGTGSSSLQQMAAFPVSTLKIDRSFVQLIGPPDELNALASAIIGLADKLGLDCIAEGVETSRQSRVLLQRGCSTAQGYFFSPPLFPNDVKRMLQSPMRPTSKTDAAPPAPETPVVEPEASEAPSRV